jgi:hypothetical protein
LTFTDCPVRGCAHPRPLLEDAETGNGDLVIPVHRPDHHIDQICDGGDFLVTKTLREGVDRLFTPTP